MKISSDIDPFADVEKLATLTQLYLELRLPFYDALRAAEADLSFGQGAVSYRLSH